MMVMNEAILTRCGPEQFLRFFRENYLIQPFARYLTIPNRS